MVENANPRSLSLADVCRTGFAIWAASLRLANNNGPESPALLVTSNVPVSFLSPVAETAATRVSDVSMMMRKRRSRRRWCMTVPATKLV